MDDMEKLEEKKRELENKLKVSKAKLQNLHVSLQGLIDQGWLTIERDFGIDLLTELCENCEQINLPLYDKDIDRIRCLLKLVCSTVLGEVNLRSHTRVTEQHFE